MNTLRIFMLIGIVGLLFNGCRPGTLGHGGTNAAPARYGQKVHFAKDVPLQFPDFVLTYGGERHEPVASLPAGITFADFQVGRAAEGFTISWSSGTGDIGPTAFAAWGKPYRLELRHSDELGWLDEDELVIWSDADVQ